MHTHFSSRAQQQPMPKEKRREEMAMALATPSNLLLIIFYNVKETEKNETSGNAKRIHITTANVAHVSAAADTHG